LIIEMMGPAVGQSDMGGQRVEDGNRPGGLAVTQPVMGVPQQDHPAVMVGHRVHLARRQFLQAASGLVQHLNQRGDFLIHVSRRR
jgi:hypothetical protein